MTNEAKQAAGVWIRLVKCHGLVMREVRRRVAQSETTLPQFDVLAQLLRHPQGMTSTELSRVLLVTAGNLTGIVDRLEARELVTRTALPDDKRVRVLKLTAKGKRLAKREVQRHEDWLNEIFSSLADTERHKLSTALDRLRHSLETQDDAEPLPE
ncbi:MAG: MarR family transcriptional regulator [Polyangiaceae bacterium]|nr:MarR family transcriptional regulator [Myxococcales bacterium]MCB9587175.1 MarR family transcriptional regulator [Polyangiaceae bacterium]